MDYQNDDIGRRVRERFTASRDAELVGPRYTFQGVLKDVSIEGFKIAVDGMVAPDQCVQLLVRGLPPLPAVILWRRYSLIGCRFEPSADRLAIVQLIRRPRWSDELPSSALYCDLPDDWPALDRSVGA